ncbi:putative F-box protein At1g67623 [Lotus japonicus]|uniref:putative F-box protein At1g67623 n=1 Tax=Lotus japonicus TaxID=34305 RepID=UPI002585967E|nr:putative F-box protein At1g67623 [Lotus japonicus]
MFRARGGGSVGGLVLRVPPTTFARRARATINAKKPPLRHIYSRLVKRARRKIQHARYKGPYSSTTIKDLPRDLIVKVVATVASQSFIDIHAVKMCCKDFLDATEDSYVWRRVSLDMFPLIQWLPNDKVLSFLKRCKECGNLESLYREGLQNYFNYPNGNVDGGLGDLKVTAQKGHKEAKYVCGMISLCSQDNELRKQGFEHMRFLMKSKCVIGSRNKVKQLLGSMWKSNGMLKRNQSPLCNSKSTCKGWRVKIGRWVLVDDDDDDDGETSSCEYCRWDHELEVFYRLLSVN